MKWQIRLSLFVLWCCSSWSIDAQRALPFQQLSKADGLSQVSVFSIAQDSTGFMWFGTRDGLNKYDGYSFTVYRHEEKANSLLSNDIRTLYVDPLDQSLWVGTLAGLSRYDVHLDTFANYQRIPDQPLSLPGNVIRQLHRDRHGRLWVGTSLGLCLYQEVMDNFRPIPFLRNGQVVTIDINSIVEDSTGHLLLGTSEGLFELRESGSTSFSFRPLTAQLPGTLPDQHIKCLVVDYRDNLWIGTERAGLHYWDRQRDTWQSYRATPLTNGALSHDHVRALELDGQGNLWVGTFAGLNKLPPGQQQFEQHHKALPGGVGLSDHSVHSLFIDARGSLWVGTYYGGVNHYDEGYGRFQNYFQRASGNSLNSDVVSSFAEDKQANLWIGTEGGGLNYYNRKTNRFTHFPAHPNQANALSGNNVKQLLLDGNQLWIGTFQAGLNVLDVNTLCFRHYRHQAGQINSLSNDNVYGLRRDGDYLWLLTYGGGLDILDLRTDSFLHYPHDPSDPYSLSSDLSRVFLETRDGKLWIGTERGLNLVFRGHNGLPTGFARVLPQEKIYALHEDEKQMIWIGTLSNGLYRYNPRTQDLQHYRSEEGLPGNTIFGILPGQAGELWLSTNNGLSRLDLSTNRFTNYDYSNGLANSEYNFNAYYRTQRGELLFGGIHGFTLFNPQDLWPNHYVPPVVFTALRQNNEQVAVGAGKRQLKRNINATETLTFRYNEANFSLQFAALDYFSPENNQYAYMLEGLDRDWNYSIGQSEASYTIQREGDYLFRLRASNSEGLWNPVERQLRILVLPPPWRTGWAYLLYATLGLGLIFGAWRFMHLRHRLALEHLAMQQKEELHQAKLQFFTNITHEFRTPLTLILGPLEEILQQPQVSGQLHRKLDAIQRHTQRLLTLVNQLLSFRKLESTHSQLQAAEGDIVTFAKEVFLSFQEIARMRQIAFQFLAPSEAINLWFDPDKLEKVLYNILSNAFKFTPDGGQISLSVEKTATHCAIAIRDNGRGVPKELQADIFKRFFEKKGVFAHSFKGTGIGLAFSRQLVAMHQGTITLDSTYGQGACFTIALPLGKAHLTEEQLVAEVQDSEDIGHYRSLYQAAAKEGPQSSSAEHPAKQEAPPDAPLLLVVEDNEEVREYILRVFAGEYRLLGAADGAMGWELAQQHNPDLIISDVMMPVMDGITFCSRIKQELSTSHIPIILLTARTALIFKLEGLETGADDYVTKPFNPDELRLRVRNLLQNRRLMREKFTQLRTLDPKEVTLTSADEEFLLRALQFVEENMANSQLTVEDFAAALTVSRPQLFLKIKALTNQTPNNFVKTLRLKRAAQLLQQQKFRVAEVAYQVGFQDPRYFRKCFYKQFGQNPSDFSSINN